MKPSLATFAAIALALMGTLNLSAETLETLVHFINNNGAYPRCKLLKANDGNFYGTTMAGGANGVGSVFKMTPGGVLTTLVSLVGTNGANPRAGLVQGTDGDFYGTTYMGGADGWGTVFKMTPGGTLIRLVSFTGIEDGAWPEAELVQGSDGNFYGTTSDAGMDNAGTVFKITPDGFFSVLATLSQSIGVHPSAELAIGSDGDFYGTARYGGSISAGAVFKVTPTGVLSPLVSFVSTNGSYPNGALVQGNDGNFYGTTSGSSTFLGAGTVFRMTPAGVLTTVTLFDNDNGANPYGGLLKGSDGNFYGTTYAGGEFGRGTVFKVTPDGVLTTLASFNGSNGTRPVAGLVQGSDGNLYGTTSEGGLNDFGTVFKLTANFAAPPVSLAAALSTSAVGVSWPVSAGNLTLEESSTPALTNSWTVSVLSRSTNAGVISVNVPTDSGTKFFRLKQ